MLTLLPCGLAIARATLTRQQEILRRGRGRGRGLGSEYEISFGTHRFHGSTLEGEVRELCRLQLSGIPRDASEREALHDCLPHALAARGYVTSGWHGNSGSFYRRSDIHPAIGLQSVYSCEALRPRVKALCRLLFVGICDEDLLRLAVGSFVEDRRAFVHVMTLDTHLPLPPPPGPGLVGSRTTRCRLSRYGDRGPRRRLGRLQCASTAATQLTK